MTFGFFGNEAPASPTRPILLHDQIKSDAIAKVAINNSRMVIGMDKLTVTRYQVSWKVFNKKTFALSFSKVLKLKKFLNCATAPTPLLQNARVI
jgi:hypothetical protein